MSDSISSIGSNSPVSTSSPTESAKKTESPSAESTPSKTSEEPASPATINTDDGAHISDEARDEVDSENDSSESAEKSGDNDNTSSTENENGLSKDGQKLFDKVLNRLGGENASDDVKEEIAGRIKEMESTGNKMLSQRGSGVAEVMAHDIQDFMKADAAAIEDYKTDDPIPQCTAGLSGRSPFGASGAGETGNTPQSANESAAGLPTSNKPAQAGSASNDDNDYGLSKDGQKLYDKILNQFGGDASDDVKEEIAGRIQELENSGSGILKQRGSGIAETMAHDIQDFIKADNAAIKDYKTDDPIPQCTAGLNGQVFK